MAATQHASLQEHWQVGWPVSVAAVSSDTHGVPYAATITHHISTLPFAACVIGHIFINQHLHVRTGAA